MPNSEDQTQHVITNKDLNPWTKAQNTWAGSLEDFNEEDTASVMLTARPPAQVAKKFDDGKIRFELIPSEFMYALASILTFGAIKYDDRNWEKGMSWGRVFGALMRHMWCWWGGASPTNKNFVFGDLDDETKKSHLWHAACCICFLVTFEERGVGIDDRKDKP